jgi:hypothetical protein
MSAIEVQSPGLLTTVQDLGREDFGPMGVSPSGAADAISLRIGNRLVGNAEGAAGLEMTLLGGTFRFSERVVIALTGSDFGATLDGVPIAMWTSLEVRPGQTLSMGPTRSGARRPCSALTGSVSPRSAASARKRISVGRAGFAPIFSNAPSRAGGRCFPQSRARSSRKSPALTAEIPVLKRLSAETGWITAAARPHGTLFRATQRHRAAGPSKKAHV